MTEHVPADQIEGIVGARRHPIDHYGRAVSDEETFYILHSAECLTVFADLKDCPLSVGLNDTFDFDEWPLDQTLRLEVDENEDLCWTDKVRSCSVCLCTDEHACTPPCSWAGPNLCTACA